MRKSYKLAVFRNMIHNALINKEQTNTNYNLVFDYLRNSGYIVRSRDGYVETEDDIEGKLKEIVATIEEGDIVWERFGGTFLVLDKRPKINDDGHHFRVIKVAPTVDGSYTINGEERSIILEDRCLLRIRHTSFDMEAINKLSFERYQLYAKIADVNTSLCKMKEKKHG